MIITICDDDAVFAEKVKKLCENIMKKEQKNQIELIYVSSGEEFLQLKQHTDILLLDIEMKDISGIDVKEKLKTSDCDTKIIFMTSHTERMREAFGKYVYGFVMKDKYQELEKILLPVIQEIEEESIYFLVDDIKEKKQVKLKDIYYIKAARNYIDIFTEYKSYLKRQKMNDCEREINKKDFFRVHKSYIVNLRYIKTVNQKEIILNGDIKVPVARGKCNLIKGAYMDYLKRKL